MIYSIGRHIFRFATKQFFRRVVVSGALPLEGGPVLVVPNHPNHFIDSLVVLTIFDRELWFLAKATIFRGALLKALLRAAHLVPVFRRQDNPEDLHKNLETFRFAAEALQEGKAVVIFPEGTSWGERKLYPIKTGAARIAFQAEADKNFGLGLKVQPVGITYTDLDKFQSSVTATLAEPFAVSEYSEFYRRDPKEAVRLVTERIERSLAELTVHVVDANHERLIEKIGKVFEMVDPDSSDRDRLQLIARNVERLSPQFPKERVALERRIDEFLSLLDVFSLDERQGAGAHPDHRAGWASPLRFVLRAAAVAGGVAHYVPYRLTGAVAHRLATHPVEVGGFKIAVGVVSFVAWYFLIASALAWCGFGFLWVVAALCGLAVLGECAKRYLPEARLYLLRILWPGQANPVTIMSAIRNDLIREMNELRVE